MKKSLIATAILGLATVTSAHADMVTSNTTFNDAQADNTVQPFVQLGLGASFLSFSNKFLDGLTDDSSVSFGKLENTSAFSQRLTLGMDIGGDRVGLDLTNFGSLDYKITMNDGDNNVEYPYFGDIKVQTYGLGLSYAHAMQINSIVHPFFGARIGVTHTDIKFIPAKNIPWTSGEVASNHASIGGFGGLEFKLSHHITLGFDGEYDQLWGSKESSAIANAFIRASF